MRTEPKDLTFVRGKFADALPLVLEHHYTHRRTADPMHVFLWKDAERIVATAIFTSPVNRYFGKGAVELARLVRVPDCLAPLSAFVAKCLRWLKKNTKLLYCLSYADTTVGHHGGIYQALNFVFVAESKGNTQWLCNFTDKVVSGRSYDQQAQHNKVGWTRMRTGKKLLYVYPLAEKIQPLLERFGWAAMPYIKPGADLA